MVVEKPENSSIEEASRNLKVMLLRRLLLVSSKNTLLRTKASTKIQSHVSRRIAINLVTFVDYVSQQATMRAKGRLER